MDTWSARGLAGGLLALAYSAAALTLTLTGPGIWALDTPLGRWLKARQPSAPQGD